MDKIPCKEFSWNRLFVEWLPYGKDLFEEWFLYGKDIFRKIISYDKSSLQRALLEQTLCRVVSLWKKTSLQR